MPRSHRTVVSRWLVMPIAAISARMPGGRDRLTADGQRVAPDILRIVLDPAVLREMLAQLLLARADIAALAVEHDGTAAGGTLVERENVLPAHVS